MKRYLPLAIAAACSLNALAVVRSPDPTYREPSTFSYAPEPVAAAASSQAATDDLIVKNLVDALNNDDQMKGAKITVMNDRGVAYLMGRADNVNQALRAQQIAAQFAGDGNVVNTIQPAHMSYAVPKPMPVDATEQDSAAG